LQLLSIGDIIHVEVVGKKYKAGDRKISAIGRLISPPSNDSLDINNIPKVMDGYVDGIDEVNHQYDSDFDYEDFSDDNDDIEDLKHKDDDVVKNDTESESDKDSTTSDNDNDDDEDEDDVDDEEEEEEDEDDEDDEEDDDEDDDDDDEEEVEEEVEVQVVEGDATKKKKGVKKALPKKK
jgi:hypothetical protein